MRISGLPALFLIFVFPLTAHADETAKAKEENDCQPVASIYEEDICAKQLDINPKLEMTLRAYAKEAGKNADREIRDFKMSSLFGLLWEKALIHKFGEKAISVSKKETNAYLKAFQKTLKNQNDANKKIVALIDDLLEKNEYAPEDYERLTKMSMQTKRAIMTFDMRNSAPKEIRDRMKQNERQIAENMVKSWKVKKLLYDEYGGRVIFQQLGLEPIDGFKALLEEIKENGNVEIHDRDYKNVFEAMEDYVEEDHNVVPEGSGEIEEYFSRSDWIYDADKVDESFAGQKALILSIKSLKPEEKEEKTE